jgi:quercetin dioxygenase-like cupin family protein
MRARPQRGSLFVCLAFIWAVAAMWVTYAQQQPAQPGDAAYTFTGKSWRNETKDLGLSGRGFEAGARSDWHTHDGAQMLFVREGRMRYQIRGQKMTEVGLHASAYLPGGVAHWHGATPDQALNQVSITFGPGIKWMEKVTDAQYSGK